MMEERVIAMYTANTLEQVFSGTRAAVLVSGIDGIALYANDAVPKRTGFSLGEVIGRAPGKLWGGNMPRLFYDRLWDVIETRHEPFVAPLTNARKNKDTYDEFLAIAPIFDEKDETLEYYLALQMGHLESRVERERFQVTFQNMFARHASFSAREKLEFIGYAAGTVHDIPILSQDRSLSSVFRELLVRPFEERFAARKEDGTLILAAQEDPERFQALYEKYQDSICSYFMRHVQGNLDIAQDLAHDTFYQAFRSLGNFRLMNASYGTYLLRIAHNILVNYFRKKQLLELLEDVPQDETVQASFPEEALWYSPHLSIDDQRALAMKYREGYSFREIAALFGISENAAKLRLSRARRKLRSVLRG